MNIRSARTFSYLLAHLTVADSLWVAGARAQAVDTTKFEIRWEVAEGVHPSADSLGRLSGIAVDRHGVVYVADAADSRLWVFDASGRSVGSIGRRGRGPGEFNLNPA